MKPLLLLDVDGVLNPYAAKPHKRPEGYETYYVHENTFSVFSSSERNHYHKDFKKHLIRVWLNPQHGTWLKTLSEHFDVRWCTSWNDEANTVIAPRINSDTFPVIQVENTFRSMNGLHWKTTQIMNFTEGSKPFVWVDDELTNKDKDFFAMYSSAPFQLMKINPAVGLTKDDVQVLINWVNSL